ncbi:unknown [Candidatus Colimorpha enterica]|uniref:Uncharacterized protein n=1 Tax=Candidatus Colimorpha enterica TaxID=3083063 RepID=R6TJ79_9BACT|nr:unknown [Candidatus Colimorpha enterica]
MNKSLYLAPVLRLDGNDVSAVSYRDYVFLKIFSESSAYVSLQVVLYPVVLDPDLAPYLRKLRAGFVGDHVLGNYRSCYLCFKRTVGDKSAEYFGKPLSGVAFFPVTEEIVIKPSCRAEQRGNVKKLDRGHRRTFFGSVDRSGYVLHVSEGRHSLGGEKIFRVGRLPQLLFDHVSVIVRHKPVCKRLCTLRGCAFRKHRRDLVKLKRFHGFVKICCQFICPFIRHRKCRSRSNITVFLSCCRIQASEDCAPSG